MLYIVATPIGNLSDLSDRANDVFAGADFILAEDTRQTAKILQHLGLKKKIISCHEHSSETRLDAILDKVEGAKSAVFCSDAGTPNLSDPGGKLVEKALERGLQIVPIPGPSALTTLISVCPFPCDKFTFLGYFPKKKGREKMIEFLKNSKTPVFFYESPHRIKKTLQLLKEKLPDNNIIIGRELTKKFEQIMVSPLKSLSIDQIPDKGEFVFALF